MHKLFCLVLLFPFIAFAAPVTYQGQLHDGGDPANTVVDMAFSLFDQAQGGSPIATDSQSGVEVSEGLFQVDLDFGSGAFDGGERWLEIEVAEQTLTPRQRISAAPMAVHALNVSESSDTLAGLNCAAGQVAKWNGSVWACSADEDTTYSAGSGLTLSGTSFSLDIDHTDGLYWRHGGNAGTDPESDFIGTTDETQFEIHVDGQHGFRIEPGATPNVIGGWSGNNVDTDIIGATIGGGGCPDFFVYPCYVDGPNQVTADFGTIGGGLNNTASDELQGLGYPTVGGGKGNTASQRGATVGGGSYNFAGGIFSTVPGGRSNTASGAHSFAAGRRAKAVGHGTFVWADNTNEDFVSTGNNQFLIRAGGGVGINTNSPTRMLHMKGNFSQTPTMLFESEEAPDDQRVAALFMNVSSGHMSLGRMTDDGDSLAATHLQVRADDGYVGIGRTGGSIGHPLHMASGAHVTAGGTWTNSSDAAAKTAFTPVDSREVLAMLASLPLTYWEYRSDPGVRHIGPTAQDFQAAFSLGHDNTSISTVDSAGVALAAIQGLHAELQTERERVDQLVAENAELRKMADRNAKLEKRMAALESLLLEDRAVAVGQ
jgi:hypothetical protein